MKGASMVTMSEVAKAAGVSRATASYALRGDPRIAPDTAQKVLNAANELKYTANLSARSLRSGHNGVIGVAIFELDRPYPSEMSAAISREATKHGLQTIVQQTSISKDSEIGILKKVTSQLCDGMIFSPSNVSDQEIRILAGGKPIVLLDALSHSPMFDTINTPCETGAQAAIDHLINVGCRNILVIGAGGPLEQTDGTIAGEHQDDATYDVTQPMGLGQKHRKTLRFPTDARTDACNPSPNTACRSPRRRFCQCPAGTRMPHVQSAGKSPVRCKARTQRLA